MVQRFIGRLSSATKPRPQQLANFIDRLTALLEKLLVLSLVLLKPALY